MSHWRLRSLFICLLVIASFFSINATHAATYTVNSPTDEASDGSCTTPYTNSANDCTLRDAIALANSNVGADTINFSIDSSFQSNASFYNNGQYTITVASVVDNISDQTTLSAASTWDTVNDRPGIKIYYNNSNIDGFTFATGSTSSHIAGLEIVGFSKAINIITNGVTAGTNCDGVNDTRERNVLHGNSYGVYITRSNSIVAGNYIGLESDGVTIASEANGGIWIDGAIADENTIGFREGTIGTCTSEVQRNVLAGTSGVASSIIYIFGTGNFSIGDISTGANNNRVSGNYVGTDKTGMLDLSGKVAVPSTNNVGVRLSHAAAYNWIGTDGDGIDDQYERNIINAATTGVVTLAINVNYTGHNRVAGNYMGVKADGVTAIGNSLVNNIIISGEDNIIGWCNTSDDATLCSNNGSVEDQRNVIGGASTDQIRFGIFATGSSVYGNLIGVGSDETSDISNSVGVFIARSSQNNSVGGSGNRANTIKFNTIGIKPDGDFTGNRSSGNSQSPIINTIISNNFISQNDTVGIQLYWTENFGDSSITISDNIINNNGSFGIDVIGSSPIITGNTIFDNNSYGIFINPAFVKRNVSGWNANEATTSYNPADASTNILSEPNILSNQFSNNENGAIYALDAKANNSSTLFTDNTFSNEEYAVQQAWYGLIEVLDKDGNPISQGSASTTTALARALTGTNHTSASYSVTGNDIVFGPSDVSYTDVTTWFEIPEYRIDTEGNQTTYNNYTLLSTGTYTSNNEFEYSFNGEDDDTSYNGVLPNGIATSGLYRFQVAKLQASTVPTTPVNISPADESTGTSVTPTLTASDFSDAIHTHASSTWHVYSSSVACAAGNTGNVYSTTSSTELTNIVIPTDTLTTSTTYYWRVEYTNDYGNTSDLSSCTSFTTLQTAPQLLANIPDQSWQEDSRLNEVFDLDEYFADPQAGGLQYSVNFSEDNITVNIQSGNIVSFSSAPNWFGEAPIEFIACDSDAECTTSNEVNLAVESVNDTPTSPQSGFSPANSIVTASQTPTITWEAGSDTEDAASVLYYELRVSTSTSPANNSEQTLITSTGETSIKVSEELKDNTQYYYVVRTIDSEGATSDWSERQTFTVNTSVSPDITLNKTLEIIKTDLDDSVVTQALSQAVGASPEVIKISAALSFGVVFTIFVASVLSLLWIMKNVRSLVHILVRNPAVAFATIVNQTSEGTYTQSYSQFLKQSLPLARLAQISAVTSLLFLLFNIAVQAQPLAATYLAPNDVVRINLSYTNNGDGAASNVIIKDTLPADLFFTSKEAQTSKEIIFNDGTITPGETKRVSYEAQVKNPAANSALTLNAAQLTANEIEQPIDSNTIALGITSASVAVTLVEATGETLENIRLDIYFNEVNDNNLVHTAYTNAEGKFSMFGFQAGTYYIVPQMGSGYVVETGKAVLEYNETTNVRIIATLITEGGTTPPDTNQNSNTNDEENQNTNNKNTNKPNKNSNTNQDNANTNVPGQTNNNTNTPISSDLPITEEQEDFLNNLSELTEPIIELTPREETILKQALQKALEELQQDITVNFEGSNLPAEYIEDVLVFRTENYCGLGSRFKQLSQKLRSEKENNEVIFSGQVEIPEELQKKLKNSNVPIKVRMVIFSDPLVQVSEVNEEGQWRMEFPLELLEEEGHVALGEVSANGVSTGVIEVTKFAIEEPECTPWSSLIIAANIVAFILVGIYVFRASRRKLEPEEVSSDQDKE